jgi:hypothetical protein
MDYGSTPIETVAEIISNLDISIISQLCSKSKELNQLICANQEFWKKKLVQDFHIDPHNVTDYKLYYEDVYNSLKLYKIGEGDPRPEIVRRSRLVPKKIVAHKNSLIILYTNSELYILKGKNREFIRSDVDDFNVGEYIIIRYTDGRFTFTELTEPYKFRTFTNYRDTTKQISSIGHLFLIITTTTIVTYEVQTKNKAKYKTNRVYRAGAVSKNFSNDGLILLLDNRNILYIAKTESATKLVETPVSNIPIKTLINGSDIMIGMDGYMYRLEGATLTKLTEYPRVKQYIYSTDENGENMNEMIIDMNDNVHVKGVNRESMLGSKYIKQFNDYTLLPNIKAKLISMGENTSYIYGYKLN